MAKNHSDNDRGNLLPLLHGLFLLFSSMGHFTCIVLHRILHTAFVTSCGAMAEMRNSSDACHIFHIGKCERWTMKNAELVKKYRAQSNSTLSYIPLSRTGTG